MKAALLSLSISLQMVGVVTAAIGLRRTWAEFHLPGETFYDPAVGRGRRLAASVRAASARVLRAVFRRPEGAEAHTGEGAVGAAAALAGRGRAGWLSLSPVISSLSELDRRTRELLDRVQDVQDELGDESAARAAADAATTAKITDVAARLDMQSRRVATGGIRLEALGLFCVALGLLCQLLASVTA